MYCLHHHCNNDVFTGLKQMRASLKRVDCIIEIHDARISFLVSNYIINIYIIILQLMMNFSKITLVKVMKPE